MTRVAEPPGAGAAVAGTASAAGAATVAGEVAVDGAVALVDADGLIRFEGRAMASPLRLIIAPGHSGAGLTAGSAAGSAGAGSAAGSAGAGSSRTIDVDAAWQAVVETFEAAEEAMSRFRETSEISLLNLLAGTEGGMVVSQLLARALVAADRARRVTGGRFDPRVARDLERLGYPGAPGVVSGEAGPSGRGRPTRILDRDGRRGRTRIDDPIDLGGIGKGLAVRWSAARVGALLRGMLDSGGGFLLDAGGDMATRGGPTPGERWSVGIEDPRGGDTILAAVNPPDGGAIATSSVRRLRWRTADGRTVHHLVDPRTGEPGGEGLVAVTVAGPDPAWAEVWSKALFLEGARGIAALARVRDLAAWWVTDGGILEMTAAARQRTTWVAAEA